MASLKSSTLALMAFAAFLTPLVAEVPAAEVVLSFAILGDAEPKPEPLFPNLSAAVDDVNRLAKQKDLDFVVGVGDIAHRGTLVQYEAATKELQRLTLPLYPIMGNEEHDSTVERFLEFATRWNHGKPEITTPRYVIEKDNVALVFASPDFSRDFNDEGIAWILGEMKRLQDKPVLLIVHGAQVGVYSEQPDKGVKHPGFAGIVAQPNLAAVISGDLHMDMDRTTHSKQIEHVHYLHIPALERTKIPDGNHHTPMFRVLYLHADGQVLVETYETGVPEPLLRHEYRFSLPRLSPRQAEAAAQ